MKPYWKRHKKNLLFIASFLAVVLLAVPMQWAGGVRVAHHYVDALAEMLSVLPAVFLLIGLMDVWVPREFVQRHTGSEAGVASIFWMIILAMLQAGPLYAAFPMVYLMWKKGTSVRNIFVYIGAFATIKLPMLGFEISFLGLEFSLLRSLFTLPVFIVVALIMDRLFKETFVVNDVGSTPGPAANPGHPQSPR
ncbi:permease [Chrysiogenes arsenatis]|uniref:permease n=1 Tax=Chrysiogenes arsenatis TaxID=309797 RepID=UPI000405B84B|nr:permease [Chrysiogenes arsenatis]